MNKTYKSLKAYLFESGILEQGTQEEIAAAKKTYRRQYLKRKKEEYRARHQTISLSFTNEDAKELAQKASTYEMRLPAFIKACVYAYLEQIFVLPNEAEVQKIELLLRQIGNNVNQITRLCNRLSVSPETALCDIHGLLQKLDGDLTELFRRPKSVEILLIEGLKQHPQFIHRLQKIIDQHSHAPKND